MPCVETKWRSTIIYILSYILYIYYIYYLYINIPNTYIHCQKKKLRISFKNNAYLSENIGATKNTYDISITLFSFLDYKR